MNTFQSMIRPLTVLAAAGMMSVHCTAGMNPAPTNEPGGMEAASPEDNRIFFPSLTADHGLLPSPRGVQRTREISLNHEAFADAKAGDEFVFDLFDGDRYTGAIEKVSGRVRSGALGNTPGGSFSILVDDGRAAGYIRVPGEGVYRVRATPAGGLIEQLNDEAFPACTDPLIPDQPVADPEPRPRSGSDDGSVIDVLVLYTPNARAAAGGTFWIEAEVDLSIDASNTAYTNSEIGFQINLAHTEEIDYAETAESFTGHLVSLTDTGDGVMDEAHAIRDEFNADMVALLVNAGGSCGVAYVMQTIDPGFADFAFSVSNWGCSAGNLTFPHELGHNMGACHARVDPCSGGIFEYSWGYKFAGNSGNWRTVMAYSPGTRVTQFSNPDINFDGVPTGVALGLPDEAHNAMTLNASALTTANYRVAKAACPADFTGNGSLDIFDLFAFIDAYNAMDPAADFTGEGDFSIFDVFAFIDAFNAGCP